MKAKLLTHKGTVPVRELEGRKKPFQLRVTVGGKRQTSYWGTREEAEKEWRRIAPLAGHPGAPVTPSVEKSLVNDREAAAFINLRERLAKEGLTVEDAARLALIHKDENVAGGNQSAKQAVADFIASLEARVKKPSKSYMGATKWALNLWLDHFGPDTSLLTIKKAYAVTFAGWVNNLEDQRGDKYSPDSVLTITRAVQACLNYAVEHEHLAFNPVTMKLRKKGLLPPPRANQGHTITVPQTKALLAIFETHYPSRLKSIATQLFIGFREEQCERMNDRFFKAHLNAFDLPPDIIRKARDGSVGDYIEKLPENLVEWLKCKTANAKAPVRPGRKWKREKGQWLPIGRKVWERIVERMKELPKPYRLTAWPKNAARHTAATVAYSHFGLERTVELLGWADMEMLKNQYAGKRWPAEEAAAYFDIRPGVAAELCKNTAIAAVLTKPMFFNGVRPKKPKEVADALAEEAAA